MSGGGYSVYLSADNQIGPVTFKLYDLITGKVVNEKKLSGLSSAKQEVFTRVNASLYSIIVEIEGCKKNKSLGGNTGIDISGN
jgi:hypothetical protein